MIPQTNRMIGGILLIAGTTIGAGMLAMPVSTGLAGFFPTTFLFLAYWIYMTYTAFLFLEVNLWFPEDVNLVTMASKTLGIGGKIVAWIFYLFLLYALTTAYVAAGGPLFVDFLEMFTGTTIPKWFGFIPLLLFFGYFVYCGTDFVDYINRLMMIGFALSYVILVFFLSPEVEWSRLDHVEWKYLPIAVSIVATSFGFHIIIPSLTVYLKHDQKKLIQTLLLGSIFPVLVYLIWEFFTLGNLPIHGEWGILKAFKDGTNSAQLIAQLFHNSFGVRLAIRCLAFFAIITSFLGVSLSLHDFLADGTGIKQNLLGRMILIILTFAPPLIIAWLYPRSFFTAMEYAGAFGVVILLGLFPALMTWSGRYYKRFPTTFSAPGGKLVLLAVMLFSLVVIGIEICNQLGWTLLR